MALRNPDFSEAGAVPGLALHWRLETWVQRERVAGFGQPALGFESFERWHTLIAAFEAGALALAFFDPLAEGLEDFEEGWLGDIYLRELPDALLSAASFDGAVAEQWLITSYAHHWAQTPKVALQSERFERGWGGVGVLGRIDQVAATSARFDGVGNTEVFARGAWPVAATL